MLTKLRHIICHPALLGMHLKDKFFSIFCWWFGFFLITVLILAGKDMHTVQLDRNDAIVVADFLYSDDGVADTALKNCHLTGTKKKLTSGDVAVYMNENSFAYADISENIILVFSEEKAYFYLSSIYMGEISYKDYGYSDFTFSSIRNGNTASRMELYEMVYDLFMAGESSYRAAYFFNDLLDVMLFYLIALIGTYVMAYLVNRPIDGAARLKLVIYDSLSYFMVAWISVLYGVTWIRYVGMIVPIFFALRSFMHIRKVVIKKGGKPNDN